MDVGTAGAEPDSGLIEQAVAEWEALRAGGPRRCFEKHDKEGGRIESCGSQDDVAHWTISFVWNEDAAVLPLAVGGHAHCHAQFTALARSMQYWDRGVHAPPVVIVDGARRHFQPAHGRLVVGVVEAPGRTLLLVAVGEALAVIHLAGRARAILYWGPPLGFRELDVDRMLRWRRSHGPGRQSPPRVRPPAAIRAHHIRIVGAVEVDVGEGPSIDTVISCGLKALEWCAKTVELPVEKTGELPVELPGRRRKRRGKTKLARVVDVFLRVILAGGKNFEGCASDILREIRALYPDFDVDVETFSNVLTLIEAAGSCLVRRPTTRTWRLCLAADLLDPTSDLHRRFCEDTVRLIRAMVTGDGPVAANGGAANGKSPTTRRRRCRSADSRADSATTAATTGAPVDDAEATESRASTGDPTDSDPQPAPGTRAGAEPSAPSEPGPTTASTHPSEPGAPVDDAEAAQSRASTGDPTDADPQPAPGSGAGAEPSAPAEPGPTTASTHPPEPGAQGESAEDRAGAIRLVFESICSSAQAIESFLEAEPDPLVRVRHEATIEGALLKLASFFSEGQFGTVAVPVADPRAPHPPGFAAARPEGRVDEQSLGAATGAERPDDSAAEEPAQVSSATAEHADIGADVPAEAARAAAEQEVLRVDEGLLAAPELDAAEPTGVEADPESSATERPGAAAATHDELLAVELGDPVETAAVDMGEVSMVEGTVEEPDPEQTAAGELEHEVPSAAGDLITLPGDASPPAAREPPTAANDPKALSPPGEAQPSARPAPTTHPTRTGVERAAAPDVPSGVDPGSEVDDAAADAELVQQSRTAAGHEDPGDTLKRTEVAVRPLGAGTSIALPADAGARCDADRDRAPRHRSLSVSENCVILRSDGWIAPRLPAPVVALERFARPAPICEPLSITDSTCIVSIATPTPEITRGPRGPPQG